MPPCFPLLKSAAIFLVLVFFPVGVSAGRYWFAESRGNWQTADRSSAGLLPLPSQHPQAIIRVYGARTVRWKAIFAIHTWIVVKEQNASTYTRYDYTAWGEPIRTNGFAADARWFGAAPETIAAVDGPEASRLIPKIRHVVENYKFRSYGDYSAWPGPNSNTFVQAVLDAVPELKTVLPPTAIGKDYPYRGEWFGLTPSGTGAYASLGGYLGLTIGWVEGLEINFLGAVLGTRHPPARAEASGHRPIGNDGRDLETSSKAMGSLKMICSFRACTHKSGMPTDLSPLPSEADIRAGFQHSCFVPTGDIREVKEPAN